MLVSGSPARPRSRRSSPARSSSKEKNFIEAATCSACRRASSSQAHPLVQLRAAVIIQPRSDGRGALVETSLSYLGFGVAGAHALVGNMVQAGANYFFHGKFWPSSGAGAGDLGTILGFHLLGDGLNKILETEALVTRPPVLRDPDCDVLLFPRQAGQRSVDASASPSPGETLGVVGESGSGKSVTALSILRLVRQPGRDHGSHRVRRGNGHGRATCSPTRALRPCE